MDEWANERTNERNKEMLWNTNILFGTVFFGLDYAKEPTVGSKCKAHLIKRLTAKAATENILWCQNEEL